MPVQVKMGKNAAVVDHRVPRMSIATPGLPPPPKAANWYGSVKAWPMLANDQYGDCVEAAILHCIEQLSGYAMHLKVPTEAEAVSFYEQATGFNPLDLNTDQGSYVLGQGGVMEFWLNRGVVCGGVLNKVDAFLQITKRNPTEWMQGIHFFGGMLTGLQIPESIISGNTVPALWKDFTGPIAGGHEIWINGYEPTPSGRVYHLVSWGQMFQATEAFLEHCIDETCVVVNTIEINSRGVNAAGYSLDKLMADMAKLKNGGLNG